MIKKDTIYALSSANGKAAVSLFRISGPNACKIIKNFTKIKKIMPRKPALCVFYKNKLKKIAIDNCVITFLQKPKTYTGEDCVEISTHGSQAVVSAMLETLNKSKFCRIADPGEFTRRAFENNKLDLTQVEGIADLVNAETESQRIQALSQLNGSFARKIELWDIEINKILANVEAIIDFSEEDISKNIMKTNRYKTRILINQINKFLNDGKYGELIRSGFRISVLGKPNTGKSSLINYLADREVSIVSKIGGTTRDVIELNYDIGGIPVIFCDTAGIRRSNQKIENYGIKKAIQLGKKSYINIILIEKLSEIDVFKKRFKNIIFVKSKIDRKNVNKLGKNVLNISSKTGLGINNMLDKIYKMVKKRNNSYSSPKITQDRHRRLLTLVLENLIESNKVKQIDFIAEEIRLAKNNMSKITGKNDIDEILDIIFNDFCIGK